MPMPLSDRHTDVDFEGLSWPSVPDYEYEREFNPLVTSDPLPVTKPLLALKRNDDHVVVRPGCHSDQHKRLLTGSLTSSPFEAHPLYPHHLKLALTENTTPTMTKNRRSLQSIVLPSFLQSSPTFMSHKKSPSRSRSYSYVQHHATSTHFFASEPQPSTSKMDDDPPPFLLDDDPFANLSSSAVVSSRSSIDKIFSAPVSRPTSPTPVPTVSVPRSPLSPPDSVQSSYFGSITPHVPAPLSPRGRIKPAYERPAFSSRPSLPSLHTLVHMSLAPPKKVRKGKVGAGLPYEPWQENEVSEDEEEEEHDDDEDTSGADTPCATRPTSPLGGNSGSGTLRAHPNSSIAEATPAPSDVVDQIGSDRPSTFGSPQYNSDRETFTFYDNISTPSLELSSASLSRSLSLESVSSSEMFLGDDIDDHYGNFNFFAATRDHDIDHSPADLLGPLLPSLCRLDTARGDKFIFHEASLLPSNLPTIAESSVDTDSEQMLEHEAITEDEPADSTGWSSSRGYPSSSPPFGQTSGSGDGYGYRGRRGYPPSGNGGGHGGDGGRGDDGDGGRRRPTHRSALSGSSTPGTSSDEEGSEEDYGQPIPCNAERVTDSEDDVPLAQRIPTALEAQRSMRQQFREERDKRRRERALKAEVEAAIMSAPPQTVLSSSQEAALIAASRPPSGRSRTRTLPSNTPRPFAPEDLARKLQDFQVAESSNLQRASTSRAEVPRGRTRTMDEAHAAPHTQRFVPTSTSPIDETASRVLRTMRSFHRPNAKPSEETLQRPSTADSTSSRLGRALSRARSRVRGEEAAPPSAWQGPPLPSSRVSLEASPPVPPLPQPRMSGGEPPRKLSKGSFPAIVLGKKTSMELERSPKPLAQVTSSINSNINIKTQQRIFICDMQRFNVVEIDNNTNADDVVNMIRIQGSLPVNGLVGHEDWMLFEVAQDFGLERPLRGYELLSDVQASWNKDKLVNMFVLKLTPLAKPLSLEATPSSAPTHGGYVEWECKKGKWSKRWLRLREHGLWLSKRDNGKDEVFLCSLSNFDAYTVTRGYNKAPKPFAFAIKSTDNLTYFENKADYLHMFSCQARDGHKWIEKILVARSYVLHQERHVLFSSRANINGGSSRVGNAPAGPLANAGIRKVRTMQPLVNLAPADVFEPGSLLSKT